MQNRKCIVSFALGGMFWAAMLTESVGTAKAEDFCYAGDEPEATSGDNPEKFFSDWEARIRKKCKVGDIIEIFDSSTIRGRVCDLHQPFDKNLCFLAPPRKTY